MREYRPQRSEDGTDCIKSKTVDNKKALRRGLFLWPPAVTLSRIVLHQFQRLVVLPGRPVAIVNVLLSHRGTPRRSSRILEPVHA